MECVDEGDETSPEAEVPEEGWDDNFSFLFGAKPLDDEPEAEDGVPDEAKHSPPVGIDE